MPHLQDLQLCSPVFLLVLVRVCVCVVSVSVCVPVPLVCLCVRVHMHTCMFTCTYGGHSSTSGVFLNNPPPYFLRVSLGCDQ